MIGLDTLAGASLESPFDGFHIYSCGRSVSGRGARLGPGERSRGLGEPGVADPGRPGRSRARVPRLGPEALPRRLGRHHVAARVRRPRRNSDRAVHLPGGDGRAQDPSLDDLDRRRHGGADADGLGDAGAEDPPPREDPLGRGDAAVSDGDCYVVNGQKIWTSIAHRADWCLLVARTDPRAEKHKGLTYLMVDMKSPGIEVKPLRQMTGDAEFNEIFFTDVKVPKAHTLGRENQGWMVAITTLMHERVNIAALLYAR
ncbi:MAG: hypothetical protein DMG07_24170, partial [Acidobacteria bacterium]